jgi:hypothetical protein
MRKNQAGSVPFYILLAVAFLFLFGGAYLFGKYGFKIQDDKESSEEIPVAETEAVEESTEEMQPVDEFRFTWKTYRDNVVGVEFEIPGDWDEPTVNSMSSGIELDFSLNGDILVTRRSYYSEELEREMTYEEYIVDSNLEFEDYAGNTLGGMIASSGPAGGVIEKTFVTPVPDSESEILIVALGSTDDSGMIGVFEHILETIRFLASDEMEDASVVSDMIRQAMAGKYERTLEDVNLTVKEINGEYAQGTVGFKGEMGGGWFLAAYVDGEWVIVDDGNGTVSCQKIEPYEFPVSMVPECYDYDNSVLVTR